MKGPASLIDHFSVVPGPRIDRHKKHKLIDIIALSICGVISSCNTLIDIEEYGNAKIRLVQKILRITQWYSLSRYYLDEYFPYLIR